MKHFILTLILILTLSVFSIGAYSQDYFLTNSPKYEIRAVWMATIGGIDWPRAHETERQKEELCKILDKLKKAGINIVFLQSRVRGTTIYPSALEPWDICMTGIPGKAPSYDPLAFAIQECHKRGMQLHAWVVTIPIGKWNKNGCATLRKKYPKMVTKIGEEGYLNPEHPETADYLARCCREIIDNYDVDGIHLDYIRYPETWRIKVTRTKGRENITRIVKAIHKEIKTRKPWVMLSCSPIGKHDNLTRYPSNGWNARTTVCQDAQEWLREGIMDALFPMMYFRDNQFFPFAIDWQEKAYSRFVVPGLGIYFLDPREGKWMLSDVTRQMYVLRDIGLGHCFFRSKFLTDNTRGLYEFVEHFNEKPALIPPMWWCSNEKPDSPKWIEVSKNGTLLTWQNSNNDVVYNVYASEDYPVNTANAAHLLITRYPKKSLMIDPNRKLNYAITIQDRYGQESEPVQLTEPYTSKGAKSATSHISTTISSALQLPDLPSTVDANYIIIETLQGSIVAVRPYKKGKLDVSALSEGAYQWRTLGKKGRTHRMGFFTIKRDPKS